MKDVIVILMLCVSMGILYGLANSAETDYFSLDTLAPQLQLQSPSGGENWFIGDTNSILWTATDTNLAPESVYLYYSLADGTDYQSLAEAISNTGTYPWLMPAAQSLNARVQIRVSDIFGNTSIKNSLGTFSITDATPASPQGIVIDTSNNIDAVISWQPVLSTIYDIPIVPDGYIVLCNETPYEDDQFYSYQGVTAGVTYTHHNVVQQRDRVFYKIIAFRDFDGRLHSVLHSTMNNSGTPRSWKSILDDLDRERGAK